MLKELQNKKKFNKANQQRKLKKKTVKEKKERKI